MGFDESRAFDKLVGQWGILSATGLNAWGTCTYIHGHMRAVDCPPFTLDVHRHVSMYVSEVHHSKPLATELHKLLLQLAFVSPSIV